MFVCADAHTGVPGYLEARGQPWHSFLKCHLRSHPGSLTDLEFSHVCKVRGPVSSQGSSGLYFSSRERAVLGLQECVTIPNIFLCSFGGSYSGPHIWKGSILLTRVFPPPANIQVFNATSTAYNA